MTLPDLESEFPEIKWREPIRISAPQADGWRYACRICVANRGLAASEVATLPDDPTVIVEHIAREHLASELIK